MTLFSVYLFQDKTWCLVFGDKFAHFSQISQLLYEILLGGLPPRTKQVKGINLSLSLAYPMLISPSFLRYPSVVITGWYRYCSIAKVLYKQRIETTY